MVAIIQHEVSIFEKLSHGILSRHRVRNDFGQRAIIADGPSKPERHAIDHASYMTPLLMSPGAPPLQSTRSGSPHLWHRGGACALH